MSLRDAEASVLGAPRIRWLALAFLPSVALHGAAFASLGQGSGFAVAAHPASEVSFVVPPPPPEQPRPPEAEAEPEPVTKVAAQPSLAKAPEPLARPEPAPATPLDLRGLTLTNDAGGFAMPVGDQQPLDRPLGVPRAVAPAPSAAVTAVPARPSSTVAFGLLGTRPAPPPLEAALREHYPADARRRAIGGSATVRARIDGDGVARAVRVMNESFGGFGEACRRTLAFSRWSPPRDASGKPVSTEVSYTCRFKVEP